MSAFRYIVYMHQNTADDKSTGSYSAPLAGEVSTSDPTLLAQRVRPIDVICSPIQKGNYGHRMRYLRTPSLLLYLDEYHSVGSWTRGVGPKEMFCVAVPLRTGPRTSFWGKPLHEKGFPMMFPGAIELLHSSGQAMVILLVQITLLQSMLTPEQFDALGRLAVSHLLPASGSTVKQFGRYLLELINATSRNPAMLEEPASIQAIEEGVLEWIGNLIPAAEQKRSLKLYPRRQSELNSVLEFMRDAGDTVITLSQLVEVTDCSARTLELAFRERFDLTPIGFLRLHRFHAARRALIAADMHETTVEQAARRCGFNHLGRFAVEYRKLFGESPSATLRRHFSETESMQSPLLGR